MHWRETRSIRWYLWNEKISWSWLILKTKNGIRWLCFSKSARDRKEDIGALHILLEAKVMVISGSQSMSPHFKMNKFLNFNMSLSTDDIQWGMVMMRYVLFLSTYTHIDFSPSMFFYGLIESWMECSYLKIFPMIFEFFIHHDVDRELCE